MSKRALKNCTTNVQSISVAMLDTTKQLKAWLEEQALRFGCTTLLAHAEDGVTWGRFETTPGNATLMTGYEAEASEKSPVFFSAALNPVTLWQARLFGGNAEVLLWREQGIPDATWHARVICDEAAGEAQFVQCFDEDQLLLGSEGAPVGATGFTRMREGSAELVHVLPIAVQKADRQHRAHLVVRQYLAKGETLARVAAARVVSVTFKGDN